jgi:hypothetical protein
MVDLLDAAATAYTAAALSAVAVDAVAILGAAVLSIVTSAVDFAAGQLVCRVPICKQSDNCDGTGELLHLLLSTG